MKKNLDLKQKLEEHDEMLADLEKTKERIREEEAKDIDEMDHAKLAWLINHQEITEHRLNGQYKAPNTPNYTILDEYGNKTNL